jgi:hypothetical protein
MLRYLAAIAELEWVKARLSKSEQENERLRAQLLSEIDSNRTREDALLDRLITKAPTPLPRRELLRSGHNAHLQEVEKEPVIDLDDADVNESEERLLLERCREYYEQAKLLGHNYPFDLLVATARQDPSFLDN